MTEAWGLVLAFLAGAALGAVYFGGLWLVVRRLHRLGAPALWLGIGAVIRLALVVVGIYLVMDGRWERLVAAMAGLLLVRTAAVGTARRGLAGKARPSGSPAREESRPWW